MSVFPSGYTFYINTDSPGGALQITTSNKHVQAGMIGGAAPILQQHVTTSCSTADNCDVIGVLGPSSGSITGDSVIGLDFGGPATTKPVAYDEWDQGIRLKLFANNGLYAGNAFNNFEGDAGIELVGNFGGSASPCITGNRVAYNSFSNCGGYGPVVVAGQNNQFDHNTGVDCSEGQENDDTSECSGSTPATGNLFDHETLTCIYGNGWIMGPGWNSSVTCGDLLTAGLAAGADYSGNVVSNSSLSGTCVGNGHTATSCLGGSQATYTNNTCTNGCHAP